jgi:hypothetical protein
VFSFNSFLKPVPASASCDDTFLPVEGQIKAWRRADIKMKWGISDREFEGIRTPPQSTSSESQRGSGVVVLFYGFGDDGEGGADPVLSGKAAWDYARKTRKKGTVWQSPHIDFDRSDAFRPRPGAPKRPKGFYFGKIRIGKGSRPITVNKARRLFGDVTGWGPEGFQFVCITHAHFPDLMSDRKMPFMALADYDIAPYGFNDFIDAPQLFSSNGILGLGIGNVDQQYHGFVIPTLILLA